MYANRVDRNQQEIVDALRSRGAKVWVISQGGGLPDLLISYKGKTLLFEVKDGEKPPSQRKLTPAEQKFFDEWTGGPLKIVNSVQEALDLLE